MNSASGAEPEGSVAVFEPEGWKAAWAKLMRAEPVRRRDALRGRMAGRRERGAVLTLRRQAEATGTRWTRRLTEAERGRRGRQWGQSSPVAAGRGRKGTSGTVLRPGGACPIARSGGLGNPPNARSLTADYRTLRKRGIHLEGSTAGLRRLSRCAMAGSPSASRIVGCSTRKRSIRVPRYGSRPGLHVACVPGAHHRHGDHRDGGDRANTARSIRLANRLSWRSQAVPVCVAGSAALARCRTPANQRPIVQTKAEYSAASKDEWNRARGR